MLTIEIEDSSAIAKISFDYDESQVGIAYTSNPEKIYVFKCEDLDSVLEKVETAVSVGKLVSQLRKDGTLVSV